MIIKYMDMFVLILMQIHPTGQFNKKSVSPPIWASMKWLHSYFCYITLAPKYFLKSKTRNGAALQSLVNLYLKNIYSYSCFGMY